MRNLKLLATLIFAIFLLYPYQTALAADVPVVSDPDRVEYEIDLTDLPQLNTERDTLTDNSGGTASGTLADVTEANNAGSADRVPTENAIASLAAKINFLLSSTNTNWEVAGTNATSALATHDANGGVKLTTATSDGDQVIIQPHANTGQSVFNVAGLFGSENSPRLRVKIKTGSAITDQIIWAGFKLTNTSTVATDDDQVFFRYEDSANSGKWQLIHSRAGTDVTTNTTITVAADTEYILEIKVGADRKFEASINGTNLQGVHFAALTDDIDFKPFVGIETDAAAAKHMYVLGKPKLSRQAE